MFLLNILLRGLLLGKCLLINWRNLCTNWLNLMPPRMSLIKIKNKIGTRMGPWGSPDIVRMDVDEWPLKVTLISRFHGTGSVQKSAWSYRNFSACGEDLSARPCQRLSRYRKQQPRIHRFYLDHDKLFPRISSVH